MSTALPSELHKKEIKRQLLTRGSLHEFEGQDDTWGVGGSIQQVNTHFKFRKLLGPAPQEKEDGNGSEFIYLVSIRKELM